MSSDPPVLGCWSQHICRGDPQAFWSSHLCKVGAWCGSWKGFSTWSGQTVPQGVCEVGTATCQLDARFLQQP